MRNHPAPTRPKPQWRTALLAEFWSYFSENRGAIAGLFVFLFVVLLAIFADVIAPHAPHERAAAARVGDGEELAREPGDERLGVRRLQHALRLAAGEVEADAADGEPVGVWEAATACEIHRDGAHADDASRRGPISCCST